MESLTKYYNGASTKKYFVIFSLASQEYDSGKGSGKR